MPGTRATRRSETRRAVFDAASDIIQTDGMAAATIAEIANRAGVSVGAIYTVFDSREDLIRRALYAALDEFEDTFVIPIQAASDDLSPIQRAYAIERLAQEHAARGGRHIARLASIAYTEAYHDEAICDAVVSFERRLERWFTAWCSAYFGDPPDHPNVRGEVRLCCDVVRGALMRVAAIKLRAPETAPIDA